MKHDFYSLRGAIDKSPETYKSREHIWHDFIHPLKAGDVCAEFGVFNGRSINHMAAARPDTEFHGFDSFKGLPEAWELIHPAGFFATDRAKLKFHKNVMIHEGWFNQTLPSFVEKYRGKVSHFHIDCDIYSSTKQALSYVKALSADVGCVLLFDEFYNYPKYEYHEFRAFLEWANEADVRFEVSGRNVLHQQVLIHCQF